MSPTATTALFFSFFFFLFILAKFLQKKFSICNFLKNCKVKRLWKFAIARSRFFSSPLFLGHFCEVGEPGSCTRGGASESWLQLREGIQNL